MSNMAMLGCIHEAMERQGYSQKDINEMIMTIAGGPLIAGASARALALTSAFWIGKVQEGGEWDFKRLFYNYDSTTTVVIGALGYTLTAEDIGNIHYGYAGRAVYSATILKTAAGAATIIGGACRGSLLEYYCDDPVDQAAINRGINWKDTGSFK